MGMEVVPAPSKTVTRVHSDAPPEREPERGYFRMFPRNENRNEGTFVSVATPAEPRGEKRNFFFLCANFGR